MTFLLNNSIVQEVFKYTSSTSTCWGHANKILVINNTNDIFIKQENYRNHTIINLKLALNDNEKLIFNF